MFHVQSGGHRAVAPCFGVKFLRVLGERGSLKSNGSWAFFNSYEIHSLVESKPIGNK